MLRRKNGATLAEIMKSMGWQKHTVRGFMAGAMKKAGHTVAMRACDVMEHRLSPCAAGSRRGAQRIDSAASKN
jgi:predicted transcriptional regulator